MKGLPAFCRGPVCEGGGGSRGQLLLCGGAARLGADHSAEHDGIEVTVAGDCASLIGRSRVRQ